MKRFGAIACTFSVDREELTSTLKKRRATIREHVADRLGDVYDTPAER